jgi:uncharacterized membrane protein
VKSSRLEAFSDGVLAILITIMVLEMKVPKGVTLYVLEEVYPVFLSYILSFLYLLTTTENFNSSKKVLCLF